jgi:hypothetical protein
VHLEAASGAKGGDVQCHVGHPWKCSAPLIRWGDVALALGHGG